MNYTYENLLDPFPSARGTAANTFTTSKDVSPTPLPATAANELKLGSKVELEAFGEFSTTGTPTLQLGFHYGVAAGALSSTGVILAASGVITTASAAASFPWHLKWLGIVTATGATGAIYGSGILDLGTSLIAFASSALPITAAARSVTIDTTTAKTFGVLAAYGTSSASNGVTVDLFTAKIINQNKPG
ncbi:MAG: hypothetical protein JO222_00855 [Frankiales bacterium]|nr:hypothetical protein [Frankiales bacterium]